ETVERTKTRSVAFDLPKDARKIIDTPAIVECPTCKKDVETARGQMFEDRARGRTLYFCDNVCLSKYKRALLEGGFRRGETPAGGQSGDK
ncbi:MAG TPA: hypothetical protein VK116_02015, partial [Planctomycetota bacterium]|nr:hypothetical protein [Planctomycetota bacterium]